MPGKTFVPNPDFVPPIRYVWQHGIISLIFPGPWTRLTQEIVPIIAELDPRIHARHLHDRQRPTIYAAVHASGPFQQEGASMTESRREFFRCMAEVVAHTGPRSSDP